jgi:hypothetical protein
MTTPPTIYKLDTSVTDLQYYGPVAGREDRISVIDLRTPVNYLHGSRTGTDFGSCIPVIDV